MIVGIHQPNYIPWLGYFYKIAKSDVFVLLDNVNYTKNSFINRNKIKTQNGGVWLTVNVLTKGRYGQLINEVEIDNSKLWNKVHWKTIFFNYSKAPLFNEYGHFLEEIYERKWEKLIDLNESLIKLICELSGIKNVKFIRASELNASGNGTDLLIDICKKLGADTYLSGFGGRNYMEEKKFKGDDIELKYYDFKHPIYKQLWDGFVPNLSVIDFLFNDSSIINMLNGTTEET
ncbi:MAG: WbqC family protein [Candidatus Aenigmarchaeota archaeon]|nr:WbqC family protein [Candidatus Aenigmarchaeota archaeon]